MSFRSIYRNPLSVISKNSSRIPTPSRRKEKEYIPTPPTCPKPTNNLIEKEQEKFNFMINLEDLLIIERNLIYILDNFSNPLEAAKACEEL